MTKGSLELIEIVTLLSFLHEMDEQPTHTLSPLAPGGRELERGGYKSSDKTLSLSSLALDGRGLG